MKWKDADFKNGIAGIRALLIYGPDAGQVDEYCDSAIEKLGIEKDNLFALDSVCRGMQSINVWWSQDGHHF